MRIMIPRPIDWALFRVLLTHCGMGVTVRAFSSERGGVTVQEVAQRLVALGLAEGSPSLVGDTLEAWFENFAARHYLKVANDRYHLDGPWVPVTR
jgi:hypothetical protein